MLKSTFILILFTAVTYLSFGQVAVNQSLYKKTDYVVRNTDPKSALEYVDSLLTTTTNQKELNTLNTAKLFPMVQAEMYDLILKNTQKLLEQPTLDYSLKTIIYVRRSLVYEIFENFAQSKVELDKAKVIINSTELKNSKIEAETLYRYSSLYRIQNKKNIAEKYIDKSIALAKKYNHFNELAVAYMVKGYLQPVDNFEEKLSYIKKAGENFKMHKDSIGVSAIYNSLGDAYFYKNEINKALKYADSSLWYAKNYKYSYTYNLAHKLKSDIYKSQGKLDSALANYEKYNKYAQELNFNKQQLKVKAYEYASIIEIEKINKAQVEKEKENIKAFNDKLLVLIIALILGIALLAYTVRTIYLKNKAVKAQKLQISKTNENLSIAVDEKEVLLQELNHRVKNNLSLILSLINFQSKEVNDPLFQSKFKTLRQRVEAIAIVHEQIMYTNLSDNLNDEHDIRDYITKIGHSLIGLDSRKIEFKTKIPKILISLDSSLPIGIIINELISNSIKHAQPKDEKLTLTLDVSEEGNYIIINYADNGEEFKATTNHRTLGLSIIDSMVKQLRGTHNRENSTYTIKILKNKNLDVEDSNC